MSKPALTYDRTANTFLLNGCPVADLSGPEPVDLSGLTPEVPVPARELSTAQREVAAAFGYEPDTITSED